MRHILLATVAAAFAVVGASQASAGTLTKFGSSTDEDFTYNSTTGNFNVTGGSINDSLLFSNLSGVSGIPYNVVEELNGGAGVNVVSATDVGGVTALTLGAFTLSYAFATPTNIDGVYVTNLLTLSVGAGTVFDVSDAGETAFWNFSDHAGNTVTFSSDLLKFFNVVDEAVSFSFSDVAFNSGGNGLNGFDAQGNGNFSSNPLPAVPEPASLALLGAGVLGLAGMRRRARNAVA